MAVQILTTIIQLNGEAYYIIPANLALLLKTTNENLTRWSKANMDVVHRACQMMR